MFRYSAIQDSSGIRDKAQDITIERDLNGE